MHHIRSLRFHFVVNLPGVEVTVCGRAVSRLAYRDGCEDFMPECVSCRRAIMKAT